MSEPLPTLAPEQPPPALFPTLSPQGHALWQWLRHHPCAPLFRNQSGPRMSAAVQRQARLRQAALWLAPLPPPGVAGQRRPWWLGPWLAQRWAQVPAWRALGERPLPWAALPTSDRARLSADLARQLWRHPPRSRHEPLICFATSGTTGHPLRVPSLPSVAADYRLYHQRALRAFGLRLQAGAGEVGAVLAGCQQRCFTYVSVNPLQGECGVVKLNLAPHEWRDPAHRSAYLDALRPELISGDPVSLAALAELPMAHRPLALLSTSMALSQGLHQQLQQRFGAPVLDLYSMNEAGPIAVRLPEWDAFLPLQPGLYIELLDAAGQPVAEGEPGEITLSGGFNPLLPLLRYRTGDHARWVRRGGRWLLADLQGRAPVRFRAADGRWLNNIEITHALARVPGLALRRWALHQHADDRLRLHLDPLPDEAGLGAVRAALADRLGPLPLQIEPLHADDKVRQYTRETP